MGWAWLLAACSVAFGQSPTWHATEVSGGTGGPFAVGTSVRVWGPTGEVFLLRHDHQLLPLSNGTELLMQSATLEQWRCLDGPDGYCADATHQGRWMVGSTDEGNHMLHPSMAVHDLGEVRRVSIVRATKGYRYTCPQQPDGKTQWDLAAFEFHSGRGVVSMVPLEFARNASECTDWGRLEVQVDDDGVPWACYTHADEAVGDAVRCRKQTSPLRWGEVIDLPRLWEADHPSFVLHDGQPVVAVHEAQGSDHRLRLHLPDPTLSPIDFDGEAEDQVRKNYPSLNGSDGIYRLAYEAGPGSKPVAYLRSCDAAAGDCSDYEPGSPNDGWAEEGFAGAEGIAGHPEFAVDAAARREFLAYETNVAAAPAVHNRVRVATRCIGDTDWLELAPREPDAQINDQVLGFGRPAFVLDTVHQLMHLSVIEATAWEGKLPDLHDPATDARLFWLRASYADLPACPVAG